MKLQASSSAGLNCPHSTTAMWQCCFLSLALGLLLKKAPLKPNCCFSAKTLLDFSGNLDQSQFRQSAWKHANRTITQVLSFPLLRLSIFFFEVGGKETFYLGKECYSDSKGGKKQLCLWKTHFHYNVLTHITEIIYVCDDKVFPSLHC